MSDTSKNNDALLHALKCPISDGVLRWWGDYRLSKGVIPSMEDLDVFKFPRSLSHLAVFAYYHNKYLKKKYCEHELSADDLAKKKS